MNPSKAIKILLLLVLVGCEDPNSNPSFSEGGAIPLLSFSDLSGSPQTLDLSTSMDLNQSNLDLSDSSLDLRLDSDFEDQNDRSIYSEEMDQGNEQDLDFNSTLLDSEIDQSDLRDQFNDLPPPPPPPPPHRWQNLTLTDLLLKSSHNSYEGGERGSLFQQLNAGVRGLEFDIHDNDFQTQGYRIGHFQFGQGVDHSRGNPTSNRLDDWLLHLDSWSRSHPEHAPIILTLDFKDDLMDNRSFQEGNLAHFNHILQQTLSTLIPASSSIPSVADLEGKTLCVLSGDQGTRLGYLYDQGFNPSVTLNQSLKVIEVHDSGSGFLWYWSGQIVESNRGSTHIQWQRHGRYDRGQKPSIVLFNQGQVLEVHQSESSSTLWYRLGTLSSQGEVSFSDSHRFESNGRAPSLRIRNQNPLEVQVRYTSNNNQLRQRIGTLLPNQDEVNWEESQLASGPLFNHQVSSLSSYRIEVGTQDTLESEVPGVFPNQALSYRLLSSNQEMDRGLIRYEPLCFVEWQNQEINHPLLRLQPFGAVSNSSQNILTSPYVDGSMVRIWGFQIPSSQMPTSTHLPASDFPLSREYQDYCENDPRWIE